MLFRSVIDRQVASLRDVLPAQFELAYAVKSNPALAIVAHMAELGLGADVASAGELRTVQRAGFAPARVLMTGPGKRDAELALAVEMGIRVITVESPGELDRLERLAAGAGRRVPILLRAAVTGDASLEKVRLIGDEGAGKFGMDGRDLLACATRAGASPSLDLMGLHAFGASNLLDAGALANHIESTVLTARRLAEATGFHLRLVDAGGGLGIPYEQDEPTLDLGLLGRRLAAMTERWAADPMLAGIRVLMEPGRFLAGLPEKFTVGRYHSLFAKPETLPASLLVKAKTEDGVIMAIEHKDLPIAAVQFHPEITPDILSACIQARAAQLREEGIDTARLLDQLVDTPVPRALLQRFVQGHAAAPSEPVPGETGVRDDTEKTGTGGRHWP